MLIVHSAPGSPGASTTALYLAAQWASTGTEVLLIEADPGGGSLVHHLGIHPTPGSASFVASGLPIGGGNLVDHSQDVLLSNLHVMPSTSSPSDAREIARWFDERAESLRNVSASEVALIIDAGRMSGGALGANLRSQATGVVVVARGADSPTSLEQIGSSLAVTTGDEVDRCVVTVGDSLLSAEEWREKCGVRFCGSVGLYTEVKGDLLAFLNRNKRKAKPWRLSLEEVARTLLPYTKAPTSAAASQRLDRATEPETITGPDPVAVEPAGGTLEAGDGAMQRPAPAVAAPGESTPQFPEAVHAVPAEAWTGAASPSAQLPPPFTTLEPMNWQPAQERQPTPMDSPSIIEPPPPVPEDIGAGEHSPPSYAPPPTAAPAVQQPPPPQQQPLPQQPLPQQQPPPPIASPPPIPEQFPPHRAREEPMAATHGAPAYPPAAQYPPPPPAHAGTHQPPVPAEPRPTALGPAHMVAHEPPPGEAPQPELGPSGSFRDWAARLHTSAQHSDTHRSSP